MLRSVPARKASTSLRCHLRLVLRQLSQRRYQSTDTDDASPPPAPLIRRYESDSSYGHNRVIRRVDERARVRGKKGSQRRLESAEPLGIKSLGQSSEVIVLRDINESKPNNKTSVKEDGGRAKELLEMEKEASSLTAKQIQDLSGARKIRPPAAEVFESIESLKPEYEGLVLSKAEFDAKAVALAKGYNIAQLRGYLYGKFKDLPTRSTSATSHTSKPVKPRITEISVTRGDLQDLKQSPWFPGTTSVEARLPLNRGIEREVQMGRKLNQKQFVVEGILRDAWGIVVEEEEARLGETEFLLTPIQFGLLLTKNSNTLRPLLESSKFYTKSRFQLYQPDNVIRIVGPQAEANAMSSVLREAFSPARSATIDLAVLQQDNQTDFQEVFDSRRLQEIMNLTRTYIQYDATAHRIDIASFVDVAINDAHRLLIALLPLPTRNKTKVLYEHVDIDQCHMETALSTRSLPFRTRYKNFIRWVKPSTRINKISTALDDATAPETEGLLLNSVSRPKPSEAAEPLNIKASVLRQTLADLNNNSSKFPLKTDPMRSYWKDDISRGLWRVKIGQLLHQSSSTKYPGSAGTSLTFDAGSSPLYFSPQIPHVFTLLGSAVTSSNASLRSLQREEGFSKTELVAHLIPSPLEFGGPLASTAFPSVEMGFRISNRMFVSDKNSPPRPLTMKLDETREVSFEHMTATIDQEIVNLSLPSHAVDLQFEKLSRLHADGAEQEANVQAFIRAVQHSMLNDSSLRAPPALKLLLPRWVVQTKALDKLPQAAQDAAKRFNARINSSGDTVPVKYLFAGFSHVEKRYFKLPDLPGRRMRVDMIEGGVTGGRRVELSMLHDGARIAYNDHVKETLQASVDLVNMVDKMQSGEIKRRVSRDVARELDEKRQTLAAQTQKSAFRRFKPTHRDEDDEAVEGVGRNEQVEATEGADQTRKEDVGVQADVSNQVSEQEQKA